MSQPRPRRLRRCLVSLGIIAGCLVGVFAGVRSAVAQVFFVPTGVVTPDVPQGARVLVSKLGDSFRPGQIVAYRVGDETWLARVESRDDARGVLAVSSNGCDAHDITLDRVVGRVVLTTR